MNLIYRGIRFDRVLCRAIQIGFWDNARELYYSDKNLLTAKLNAFGQTALHLAVETGENLQFLENLLTELNADDLPNIVDYFGYYPAYTAATIGNTAP